MDWKNISITAAASAVLLAAAPVYADPPQWAPAYGYRDHERDHRDHRDFRDHRDHRDFRAHDHRRPVVIHEQTRYVTHRVVVVDRAPAVAYREAPDYGPPPQSGGDGLPGFGVIGGAVAGALIGNQFGEGNGKLASTAAGAVVGAYAGNRFVNGY
jgi:hypothetical protein